MELNVNLNRTFPFLALCTLVATALTGCGAKQLIVSAAQAPQSSAPAQITAVESGGRLPLETIGYRKAEIENYKKIGAQFLSGDKEAYQIAAAIYAYRDYRNMLIFEQPFDDISKASRSDLVEIAVSQTPHIDIYGDGFADAPDENPVKAFYLEQKADGHTISLLTYGDDARTTAKELFGPDFALPREDGSSFHYNADLDLYYLGHEGTTMVTDYPIVLSVERDGNYLRATVTLLSYWDCYNSWAAPNGSWDSGTNADISTVREYLTQNLANFPRYTFTLTQTDRLNGLAVTGFSPG